jgi:hypothetical protein
MDTPQPPLAGPASGDVVIAPQAGTRDSFLMWQFPDGSQVLCRSRETAITMATWFARRHGLDVWLADGTLSRPLSTHRPEPFRQSLRGA